MSSDSSQVMLVHEILRRDLKEGMKGEGELLSVG